jgi:signal recognition particle subunit SRP54
VQAIIQSMTREERHDPSIINGSRRRRIAAGSGTTVQEVNELLSQFNQMRKLLGTLNRWEKSGKKGRGVPMPFLR